MTDVKPASPLKVWDPFVRGFHWLLAALFVVAFHRGRTDLAA